MNILNDDYMNRVVVLRHVVLFGLGKHHEGERSHDVFGLRQRQLKNER